MAGNERRAAPPDGASSGGGTSGTPGIPAVPLLDLPVADLVALAEARPDLLVDLFEEQHPTERAALDKKRSQGDSPTRYVRPWILERLRAMRRRRDLPAVAASSATPATSSRSLYPEFLGD